MGGHCEQFSQTIRPVFLCQLANTKENACVMKNEMIGLVLVSVKMTRQNKEKGHLVGHGQIL